MYNKLLKFEWDENKRQRTVRERQMDFADLQSFDWEACRTIHDDRREYPEPRYVSYGYFNGRLIVVGWCWRGDAIRIFSLRKANKREVRRYEQTHV